MKTNTSKYLPFECISANILIHDNEEYAFPFINGTGFFCQLNDYFFYITAKHCFKMKENEDDFLEKIKLPYDGIVDNFIHKDKEVIVFSEFLLTSYEKEDILILVVDKNIDKEKKEILKKRSLLLYSPNHINLILKFISKTKNNIRTIGFPKKFNHINYEFNEKDHTTYAKDAKLKPRGFYGKMVDNSNFRNRYGFEEANWKDEYNGFSGAPVFALIPNLSKEAIVIGVILTATKIRGEFLSINVATNLITEYVNRKL